MFGSKKANEEPLYDYADELMQAYNKADPRLYKAVQESDRIYKEIESLKAGYKNSQDYLQLDNSYSGPAKAARSIISDYKTKLARLQLELEVADKKIEAIESTIPSSVRENLDTLDNLLYVSAGIKNIFIEYALKYMNGMPSRHKELLFVGYMGIYLALFRALYRNSTFYYKAIEDRIRQMLRVTFHNEIGLNSNDYKIIIDNRDKVVDQMDLLMRYNDPINLNIFRVKSILNENRITEVDNAFCMVFTAGMNDSAAKFHEVYE